jgi:hypothetical protein
MNQDEKNVYEAKNSLKSHIKFLETLLEHIKKDDPILKGRAMWATWCLHRYINDGLINDIETAMREHGSN